MTTTDRTKQNQLAVFISKDGKVSVDVRIDEETAWLTQAQMSELFETTPQNITLHVNNIFEEGELEQKSTCKDFLQVRKEGKRSVSRELKHYNLDIIISVGYRVKSQRGTQFRQWANTVLKQHLIQGYSVNEKRLAQVNKLLQIVSRTEDETISGVASVLQRYTAGLDLLDDYDYQRVTRPKAKKKGSWRLTDRNRALLTKSGGLVIANNTLAAMTLMIGSANRRKKT